MWQKDMITDIEFTTNMMEIFETRVSIYDNIRDTNNVRTATIESLLRCIQCGGKTGDVAHKIESIRIESDKEKRSAMKKELPVIMWQGTFNSRCKSGLKSLSGILCIDIDHKSEPELSKIMGMLVNVPWILAFFRSPSGDGLKVLVKTSVQTAQDYENCYAQLIDIFHQSFQCDVDESCKEYSKACYMSYDPGLYVNRNVQDYPFSYDPSYDRPCSVAGGHTATHGGIQFNAVQPTSQEMFINHLTAQSQNLTDEDILRILDKKFHRYPRNYEVGHRRDSIYNQAIVMCKAGISDAKASDYLKSQYLPLCAPIDELENEIKKAYTNFQQQYGSERGQYKSYQNYLKSRT